MFKKINDFLSGIPATAIGGVFLLCDFVLSKIGIELPVSAAWVTVIICGIPLLYLAVWRSVHNKGVAKISSAHLICVAMIAAAAIGDIFASGEVAFIMAVGAILEDMTTERAKKGLKKLIDLAPAKGRRIVDGKEETIDADMLRSGDIVRILPGEIIPVDGVIINGESSVDQSVMTGEALPVDKNIGDEVFCGTLNLYGAVDLRATKTGNDSSLQRLIQMVKEAENKKAPMARIADRAASWLVPAALLIAVVAGIVTKDIVRAVTVLVVFCPCALVLATPTAIMAAIGQRTKHGVIIKSGEALEKMGKVNLVAFDKTGTLTYGKQEVCDVVSFKEKINENELLYLSACAEMKSEHPLGRAITHFAKNKKISLTDAENFKMNAGKGVCATVDGRRITCGNEKMLLDLGISLSDNDKSTVEQLRMQGKATVLVAEDKDCIGVIALSDVIRPEATNTIKSLNKMNVKTVLLTGDNAQTANYFASLAGVDDVRAELLPADKVNNIDELTKTGNIVCLIGDGVNDAPALKTADVGIAVGDIGSDIALESADIVLMNDGVSKILYLKRLSDAAVKTIKISITVSMLINLVAVTLSVLGYLNPTTGALVHNAGSCFVVLFAALLYDRKFE